MALDLLDWPAVKDVDTEDATWQLGISAMREIQSLPGFGGKNFEDQQTTSENVRQMFAGLEQAVLPLDMPAFNRYHHGGKVITQDWEILEEAITLGEAEGQNMPATRELVQRLKAKHGFEVVK